MNEAVALHDLQQIDLALLACARRLAEVQSQLEDSQALMDARQQVEATSERVSTWRARVREMDLAMESLISKIRSGEERLYSGQVHNPKELASLELETTHLKQRLGAMEEEALQAMEQVDDTSTALDTAERQLRELESAWQESQARLSAEQDDLQRRLASLRHERQQLAKALSANALRAYDYLRQRKGSTAVAQLKDGVCQGCRVSVSANKVREVHAGNTLISCGNCDRILYSTREG